MSDAIDLVDQAFGHCRNIQAVANLLQAAAGSDDSDPLGDESVHDAAALIAEQSARLQELIHRLHDGLVEPPARR